MNVKTDLHAGQTTLTAAQKRMLEKLFGLVKENFNVFEQMQMLSLLQSYCTLPTGDMDLTQFIR